MGVGDIIDKTQQLNNSVNGHGIILNMSNFLPFVFEFNPVEIDSRKKINYITTPNIGGSHKKRYFTGFESAEVSFTLMVLDKTSPVGVKPAISYFDQLRQPDPGLFGIAASFGLLGNENYPPPQILFQFGYSYIPLVWDVLDVGIKATHFKSGLAEGIVGIPIKAEITLKLGLVEDHILNKANRIAEKANMIYGSVESVMREGVSLAIGGRKESLTLKRVRSAVKKVF